MKSKRTRPLIAACCLLAFIGAAPAHAGPQDTAGKPTAQDVKKEMVEAARTMKNYSAAQRDKAVKTASQALETVDARIEGAARRMQQKWTRMNKEARAQAADSMKELHRQRNEAAEWYGGLKHSSDSAWEEVKGGFLRSYEALQQGIQKAAKEF